MKPSSFFGPVPVCLGLIVFPAAAAFGASVIIEAENGALGSDLTTGSNGGAVYVTAATNETDQNGPGAAERAFALNVSFPEPGEYELYVRLQIGPGGADDDSFFHASRFGTPASFTAGEAWTFYNSLASGGFTLAGAVVEGTGEAGIGMWKWINLSTFSNGIAEPGQTFTVTPDALHQTFWIGAREDGLLFDKFVFGTVGYAFTVTELNNGGPGREPPPPQPGDLVHGDLIQFNNNGTWSWYMDERAVVDSAGQTLIAGSSASAVGVGGSLREGDVETVVFDLSSGTPHRYTLKPGSSLPSVFYADDHNAPGLIVRPDGKYLAVYAGHNSNRLTYWRIFDPATGTWTDEDSLNWDDLLRAAGEVNDFNTTYSNVYYLSAEDRVYNFVRSFRRSNNIMVSDDLGESWSYGGMVIYTPPGEDRGYNNGYFRYTSNGVNRIDFITTEAHPRDYNTGIYHGYITGGQTFLSDGTLIDDDITDTVDAPESYEFTPVYLPGEEVAGVVTSRAWTIDLQRYSDGSIQAFYKTRWGDSQTNPSQDPEHAFFFARFDPATQEWTSTFLCLAGRKMYSSEQDYTGLGALDPNNPNVLYLSTTHDPRDATPYDPSDDSLGVREIFRGETNDHGATWSWSPITENSTEDNFRPIIPPWDANNTALLWFRGDYLTAQRFDTAIVGLLQRDETRTLMHYVDAAPANTTLATGGPLATTGPASTPGADDNQWHLQTEGGNGGSVYSASEAGNGEDAPTLATSLNFPEDATYDIWVCFWGDPAADWRVRAGLSPDNLQVYRSRMVQQVTVGEHETSIVTQKGECFLYRAYLGRVSGGEATVYIDDASTPVGATSGTNGNTTRTWYDGLSYARVIADSPSTSALYRSWTRSQGLVVASAPSMDYDRDGWSNALEFVFGSNPKVADKPTSGLERTDNGAVRLSFPRREASQAAGGYAVRVALSSDLTDWTILDGDSNANAISVEDDFYGEGVERVTVTINPSSLDGTYHQFIRLEAEPIVP